MYQIVYTNRMKRDAKLMQKRGKDLNKLVIVLSLLANQITLPSQYRDHQLVSFLQLLLAIMRIYSENNYLANSHFIFVMLIIFISNHSPLHPVSHEVTSPVQ